MSDPRIDPARQGVLLARIEPHARPLAGLLARLAAEPGINRSALAAAEDALQCCVLLAAASVTMPNSESEPVHPFDRPEVAALLAAWIGGTTP